MLSGKGLVSFCVGECLHYRDWQGCVLGLLVELGTVCIEIDCQGWPQARWQNLCSGRCWVRAPFILTQLPQQDHHTTWSREWASRPRRVWNIDHQEGVRTNTDDHMMLAVTGSWVGVDLDCFLERAASGDWFRRDSSGACGKQQPEQCLHKTFHGKEVSESVPLYRCVRVHVHFFCWLRHVLNRCTGHEYIQVSAWYGLIARSPFNEGPSRSVSWSLARSPIVSEGSGRSASWLFDCSPQFAGLCDSDYCWWLSRLGQDDYALHRSPAVWLVHHNACVVWS